MNFIKNELMSIASKINGIEYIEDIPKDVIEKARSSGIVICFGHSDDLFEMCGAFNEELDSWINGNSGTKTFVSTHSRKIIAEWCRYGSVSWTYDTDIPSENFVINDDGLPYCIGIIFFAEDGEEWGEME